MAKRDERAMRISKKGVPKIFLDFSNFHDVRAYKWVVENNRSGLGVSE
jgi:hypothetical protein